MKQLIKFLLNVNLLSNYGVIWDIILNPQSAIFGFFEIDPDLVILIQILYLWKKNHQEMKEKLKLSLKNGVR